MLITATSRRHTVSQTPPERQEKVRKRHFVLVGHLVAADAFLDEREQREPLARADVIARVQRPWVCQGVVVEEDSWCDDKGDDDIDAVVLVAGQDEERPEEVHDPRGQVKLAELARCV